MSIESASMSDPSAPKAEPLVMPPRSRYAGQALDVSSRRSVEIKPQASGSELIAADDTHCVVDNFYHQGKFWRAVIPLDGVEKIYGQTFNFSKRKTRPGKNGPEVLYDKQGRPRRTIPMLNHLQCRFSMRSDRPIELYDRGGEISGEPVHRIRDVIYSLEAVGPVGITFNMRDAMLGSMICAHRFLSLQEMVFERIVVENQYLAESPPLPLRDEHKRELLVRSLRRSHHAGMNERYYLYRPCATNNCTSNPFRILDDVVHYSLPQRIGAFLYRLPMSPRFYLKVRGMDSDPTYRKLLRDEFADYIADEQVQQRKRDHVRQQIRLRRAARKERG